MQLPHDWNEFISSLRSHRVRFLIVGAHAMAQHGVVRFSQDLDVFVEPTPANARRLGRALADFGYRALAAAADQFAITFERAWRGRKTVTLGGRRVGVIGLRELVANKRATGRQKDQLDVAQMEAEGVLRPASRARRRRTRAGRRSRRGSRRR